MVIHLILVINDFVVDVKNVLNDTRRTEYGFFFFWKLSVCFKTFYISHERYYFIVNYERDGYT